MPCRWPEKIRYGDQAAAVEAISDLYRHGKGSPDVAPYPCGNHWHIGHDIVRFKKRIRTATRRRNPKRSKRNRR